jgi:hypothetical protein
MQLEQMQLEERKQAQKEVKRRGKEEVLPAADVITPSGL